MSDLAITASVQDQMGAWRRHLTLLGGVCAIILMTLSRDVADLADQWWNSSTFSHCLLLIPVIGWLVWLRRDELAKLTPTGWWPGLIWLGGGALVWLVGDAVSVDLFRQIALIIMLQGCVAAILGPQVTRGLLFPLFYAFFLVPFGEELVPPMQMITADMAMVLLKLFGIPAHIEGIFITTPGGYFAVAEACSGVKFLVAMAALAVLAAHLCFADWKRRAVFLAFAIIVPVLANGVRAFSTIVIAEYYGTEFAAGADHVIYGWVFFGVVIALVGLAARPWFDRAADDIPIDGAVLAKGYRGHAGPGVATAAAAMLMALAPVTWSAVARSNPVPLPTVVAPTIPGWTEVADSVPAIDSWRPSFDGADAMTAFRYTDGRGAIVNVIIVGFTHQGEGRELVGFGQGAVDPDSDWRWGQALDPIEPARIDRIADGGRNRDVLTVYSVGGGITGSATRVKLLTLRARFSGNDSRAYAVLVSATPMTTRSGREQIAALVSAAGGVEPLVRRLTQAD
jgi:exosortase A